MRDLTTDFHVNFFGVIFLLHGHGGEAVEGAEPAQSDHAHPVVVDRAQELERRGIPESK